MNLITLNEGMLIVNPTVFVTAAILALFVILLIILKKLKIDAEMKIVSIAVFFAFWIVVFKVFWMGDK